MGDGRFFINYESLEQDRQVSVIIYIGTVGYGVSTALSDPTTGTK